MLSSQGQSVLKLNLELVETPVVETVNDVYLSSAGTLVFMSNLEQTLHLSLMDMNGSVLTSFNTKEYGEGRHALPYKNVLTGMYVLKAVDGDGQVMVAKVFANQ